VIPSRNRLIVALDVADCNEARQLVDRLGDSVSFYKIGYRLGYNGGLELAKILAGEGKQVFIDLKLHDIGNTVAEGVESLTRLSPFFLTVHAYPQTMKAAILGRGTSATRLLGVTVLTSYQQADLDEAGYAMPLGQLVEKRARQCAEIGMDGLVCSAWEVSALKPLLRDNQVIVTPGIRPSGSESGDQQRIMTPAEAIRAGSDYLVIGRPITQASNPQMVAAQIQDEIQNTLEENALAGW
jgi:orotidine-5'-phosphate decarboxylase